MATKPPQPLSAPCELMAMHLTCYHIPAEREFLFAKPERRWRADFALMEHRLLIEVDGGTWTGGRHTRGKGFESDCEKTNWAVVHGWRVLRFTSGMVLSGNAIDTVVEAIGHSGNPQLP